jgi:hypothetical protein
MNPQNRSQEQRILRVMRKVLSSIVKETTPARGMRHPLTEKTIEDIRQCFKLIAAREHELMKEQGLEIKERPQFTDQPRRSQIVSMIKTPKSKPMKSDE